MHHKFKPHLHAQACSCNKIIILCLYYSILELILILTPDILRKCKDFFGLFSSCCQGPVVTDNDNFILDCQFDKVTFQTAIPLCNKIIYPYFRTAFNISSTFILNVDDVNRKCFILVFKSVMRMLFFFLTV